VKNRRICARQAWDSRVPALLVVAASLHTAVCLWPSLEVAGFAGPSGWMAGVLMGAPVTTLPGCGVSLQTGCGPVTVTKACSGFDFFVLLFAATAWLRLRNSSARRFGAVVVSGLLASYLLALSINAGRIILAVTIQAWTLRCLGEGFAHATHLAVGVLSFLPVLLIACSCLERSAAREY
jgi:exosortase K